MWLRFIKEFISDDILYKQNSLEYVEDIFLAEWLVTNEYVLPQSIPMNEYIPESECCMQCGKETDRDDSFCSNSCKKYYLIG
ncbi:hypothetical protein [Cytobacillus gottheilii]|uniref:hypothetical protein n=1 Tax=Cytobacillus gottheilii TaxID=859144 RepID=UPI0009BC6C7D|nr:hypothetical protein [Cytobacillus gottheilii]